MNKITSWPIKIKCHSSHHHRRRRQGLGLMASSNSEFDFAEFFNLWTFGRAPWTGAQPDTRHVHIQDNTIQ